MAQNIYDQDEFFNGYRRLSRQVTGLDSAPEWPALRAMLPPMPGARVIDLGCGFGWFCRWAREHGAAAVLGIDLSEKMLAQAQASPHDPAIRYQRGDLETLSLAPASCDLVYSSLTFHYIAALERLWAQVYAALIPGGSLVFSVEHPIYTAPSHPGWVVDEQGIKTWPVDSYQVEGPRSRTWYVPGVIKQHRLISTYVNLLICLGFTLTRLEEWGPTDAQINATPELAEEKERPMFFLVGAKKI
jgi:SAM-dependent methyltransferase